eukprot:gene9079-6372_t
MTVCSLSVYSGRIAQQLCDQLSDVVLVGLDFKELFYILLSFLLPVEDTPVDERNIAVHMQNGMTDVMTSTFSHREREEEEEEGLRLHRGHKEEKEQNEALPPKQTGASARNDADQKKIDELFLQYRWRIMISLWVLGLVNNFHYNLVISAADALAAQYNMKRLVALISFANVFFGIIARVLNAFVANRVSFNLRMTLMVILTVTGLFLNAFSAPLGGYNDPYCFLIVILGVSFSGTAYSYGECVALTYIQRYPSYMVGAWSSGTGISGVITSVLYIILINAGVTKRTLFLASSPLTILYWLAFCVGLVAPHRVVYATHSNGKKTEHIIHRGKEEEIMSQLRAEENIEISDYEIKMFTNLKGLSWKSIPRHTVSEEVKDTLQLHDNPEDLYYPCCQKFLGCLSTKNFLRDWWHFNGRDIVLVHKTMWWFYLNLAIVYVSEYVAQFMAPFTFYCIPEWQNNFFVRNSYPITQVCYQAGVFFSRSSLSVIQIKAVGILSILQAINAVCWLVQSKTLIIGSKTSESKEVGLSFILYVWMLYVGLLGGASYVNCFFLILQRSFSLQEQDIEARMLDLAHRESEPGSPGSPGEVKKQNEITGRPVLSSSEDEEEQSESFSREDERDALHTEARRHLVETWQRRRELAMATGSLYAMCAICLGTTLDVVFTNTILKNTSSCK